MYILKLRAAAAAIVGRSPVPVASPGPIVQVIPTAALQRWPHQLAYSREAAAFKPVETGFTFAPAGA